MAIFKELTPGNIKSSRSYLSQLIDVLQEDISGSSSRRKYQVFVTGGVGPGVTSSLFQTVYDQDFSLQTANAVMDMTVGLFEGGTVESAVSNAIIQEPLPCVVRPDDSSMAGMGMLVNQMIFMFF